MGRGGVAIALLVCGCSFSGAEVPNTETPDAAVVDEPDSAPPITDRALRKQITLTPPTLSSPLTGLPVAIILPADADLAASARGDAADIVFTEADGLTPLNHEIEDYDSTTGALTAWVRVPEIAAGHILYMHYGKEDAVDQQNPAGVWQGVFAGVWHLSDRPATATYVDSAGGNDGVGALDQTPNRGPGAAGFSAEFDGVDDEIDIGDPVDGSLDFDQGSFAFSMWLNTNASVDMTDVALHKGGSSANNPGYCYVLGEGQWRNGVGDDSGEPTKNDLGVDTDYQGRWVHLMTVVDRTNEEMRAYGDATLRATNNITGMQSTSSTTPLTISRTVSPYLGRIDEVRIYNDVVSFDWIRVEFANLSNPSTFFTLGPEENVEAE